MFWRMVRSLAVAAAATAFVELVPDLARYLRIRQPEPRPAEGTDGVRNA